MKILIAADMEGISGVVNWDQVDPQHPEYSRFREAMTGDVNAAVQGAFSGGASEVLVSDGHNLATNLLIEDLDPRVRLNCGTPSPFSMVQGADQGINGVFLVGYHARAGTPHAILDHTWSSRTVFNVWLNDVLVGETGLNAALCGHYGVPVVMISGDQAVCAEAVELLGEVETAQVKRATGRMAAECLPIENAQALIFGAAESGVGRLFDNNAPPPYRVSPPVRIGIEFIQSEMADAAALMPGTERNGRRIDYTAPSMPEAYRAFRALVALARSS
jgi:D-amino peptidase